jgi:hypothetical protein
MLHTGLEDASIFGDRDLRISSVRWWEAGKGKPSSFASWGVVESAKADNRFCLMGGLSHETNGGIKWPLGVPEPALCFGLLLPLIQSAASSFPHKSGNIFRPSLGLDDSARDSHEAASEGSSDVADFRIRNPGSEEYRDCR